MIWTRTKALQYYHTVELSLLFAVFSAVYSTVLEYQYIQLHLMKLLEYQVVRTSAIHLYWGNDDIRTESKTSKMRSFEITLSIKNPEHLISMYQQAAKPDEQVLYTLFIKAQTYCRTSPQTNNVNH